MQIKSIYSEYQEYQQLVSNLDNNWVVKDQLNLIELRTENGISLDLLKTLNSAVENFEIYCNPFTEDCEDIIENIEIKHVKLEEIESISIQLEKVKDLGGLDFYFFDKKSALISLQNIIRTNSNAKINIGIPDIDPLETQSIVFIPLNNNMNLNVIENKEIDKNIQENIKFYLSNNRRDEHSFYFNPYSFILYNGGTGTNSDDFSNLIKSFFYITTLECLTDKKENEDYVIRGEKNVVIMNNDNFTTNNYASFVDIFNFLISAKRFTEKYIIIKKVFSIYITDKDDLSSMDNKLINVWKTINHYYNHYIEESLDDFFETKDKLLKEAMNASKIIYEQTDRLYTTIVASMLSIIIVFVTTIYRSLSQLTITYFILLIILFGVFSLVYYHLMNYSAHKRYTIIEKQFSYFLEEISLMEESEVKKMKTTYLQNPFDILKEILIKLKKILITINILMLISLIIFVQIKYSVTGKFLDWLLNLIEGKA